MKDKAVSGLMLTLLLTSVLVLALNIKSVEANTYYYYFDLSVTPESPTSDDEIDVKISFVTASESFDVTFGSISHIGNQFLVDIIIYYPIGGIVDSLGYEEKTYNLGRLPAGTYSINATVTVTGAESGYSYHNKSFSVTPSPKSVGGEATPINKLTIKSMNSSELLAPYIGLTILLAVSLATVVYVKKRKLKHQ